MIRAVIPTLHCGGRCLEAIALYREALGLVVDYQLLDEATGRVRHTEARIGEQRIRISDGGAAEIAAASQFLAVVFETSGEVDRAFALLAESGRAVQTPHRPEFAGYMSEVYDRFGFRWFLMVD